MARVAPELICESCGYPLGGLARESRCPECGRPVLLSVPERRQGSLWQRRAGLGGLAGAGLGLLRRPQAFWDRVKPDRQSGRALAAVHAVLAAVLGVGVPGVAHRAFVAVGIVVPLVAVVVYLLTMIESAGLRFWGRVHGGRVTKDVAWAVCGHAAVGWTLGGAAAGFGWVLGALLTAGSGVASAQAGHLVVLVPVMYIVSLAAGSVGGLLLFEVLTYVGVRRMRFANQSSVSALSDSASGMTAEVSR